MAPLSPRLWDIRFPYDLLSGFETRMLSDEAFRCLMTLVAVSAAGLVWTYSPPGDGSLPDDDEVLARMCAINKRKWHRIRPELEPYFKIKRGKWHLDRAWVEVDTGTGRAAIPQDIQRKIAERSQRRCTYCGDPNGPFDLDHIMPVSKGGSNEPANLTLACASCNRSKGGKTLLEWFSCFR